MKFTAQIIAGFLKGEIIGDPNVEVTTVAKIEEGHKGAISFLANMNYEQFIYSTESSIVLVNDNFEPSGAVNATMNKVANAYEAFASLLSLYEESLPKKKGIHKASVECEGGIGDKVAKHPQYL